jgi:Zn ribbon nucleic-acid-binding protein
VRPHNACGKCGFYKGRKVDHTIREEEKKKREAS